MTNYKKIVVRRRVAGMNIKEIDFDVFEEASDYERVLAIHEYPDLFMKRYKKMTELLLNGLGNGFAKASPMDAIKSSNCSGNSDVTSDIVISKVCITSNSVEAIYEYGKNQQIDNIIMLERAINLYSAIIGSFDNNVSKVLRKRLEGKSYVDMESELNYEIETMRQYVYRSKKLLKEKCEETIAICNARDNVNRRID